MVATRKRPANSESCVMQKASNALEPLNRGREIAARGQGAPLRVI